MISLEFFKAIIDTIGDPVFAKDQQYRYVFVNDAACQLFGILREQHLGKTDYELFPKEQVDIIRGHDNYVFETGKNSVHESEITNAVGKVRTIVIKRTLYANDAGEKYIVGVMQDITEHKRAEEALYESEAKYRTLVENSLVGVYIREGNLFRFVNKRFCEIHGYSYEEMVDKMGPTDIVHPEDRKMLEEKIKGSLTGELENVQGTHRIVRKDGTVITVSILGNPMIYKGQPATSGIVLDITEQERAQEELLQKTALLEAQVNASLDGIIVVDKGRKILQNQQVNDLLKLPRQIAESDDDEAQIEWVKSLVGNPEEFRRKITYMFAHQDEAMRDELEFKDGTVLERYSSPVIGKNGKRYGRIWTFRDITERKRSEETLRNSQIQLSDAMDLAKIVYWELDPATQTYIFDDSFYTFYGTTAEREGGYRMSREEYTKRFIHPDDQAVSRQFMEENTARLDLKSVTDVEHRIIRRDGEVRHILVRTRIIRDDSGRIIKRYGANQDITERKRMEETVQESEEQFRTMFEESPFGMVMVRSDFGFIRANAAFCRMLGYTKQELSLFTFKDITHPDHIEDDVFHINDLISGKIPLYRTEKRYVRKDKEIVWGSVTVNIMRGRDNRFLYLLAMIEDITQHKQSEEEKMRLEAQLFRSQKMEAIGTLAGGIAHDFNNILTVLVGYVSLLKMSIDNATLLTYVDQVLAASQKATDLIHSLLAFSRQQAISLKPVSIRTIIQGTEKLLKRLVTEDIVIKTLLTTEDIIIMGDATQIDQILFNLATNARDAMPKGGTLTIETKAVELSDDFQRLHGYGEPGPYVLLSISDTGVGINEATREKIFDPFFTTKEAGKGTGLGLSTVYGVVKQHNGHIAVYSEPNVGTTFHIYLPAVKEIDKEEEPSMVPVMGGNETILVTEDNESVRGLISKVLIEYGYITFEAVDGEDAIEQFKKNADKIDLLILDSVMPKKNGREAYNEIQKIKPDVRVIFTSGYTRDVVLDKGIEDKKFDFLQKPLTPNTLLQKIRDVLDNGQDRQ